MAPEYVDITDAFFGAIASGPGQVIQSPLFDPLVGTRATEVANPRLDTGLIPLTKDEISFDVSAPLTEQQLVGVMNKLLVLLASWLDHSSLPLTVMSCRYVQTILEEYAISINRVSMKGLGFRSGKHALGADALQLELVHRVLRAYVVGVCKFVGVCVVVGLNVLYEEEDMTTRAMDLSFLTEVAVEEVIAELDQTAAWCGQQNLEHKDIIIEHLKLMSEINKLPIMFNLNIDLFQGGSGYGFFADLVKDAVARVDVLAAYDYSQCPVPAGSFSNYIQATMNNRNIPGEIKMIEREKAFAIVKTIMEEVLLLFSKGVAVKDVEELATFLRYDVELRDTEFSAITRGFFQLFLVRDDQSIEGSRYTVTSITVKMMESLNLHSSVYSTKAYNLAADKTARVELDLANLIKDIETGVYQMLINSANNKCRQRQVLNKTILIWDTLQVNAENFEVSLFQSYQINDKFNESNDLSLPITSFVYKIKLESMVDYLLKGFDLELYKPFEVFSVYYYATYLVNNLNDTLENRVLKLNRYKLQQLTNKKKKSKNKAEIEKKRQELLKIIHTNELKLEYYTCLYSLLLFICNYMLYLHHKKTIDLASLPKSFYDNSTENFDKLYRLRFKCFESIGVPAPLGFSSYRTSIRDGKGHTVASLVSQFEALHARIMALSHQIEHPNHQKWVVSLAETCTMYCDEIAKAPATGALVLTRAGNGYFPRMSIVNS